MSRLRLAAAFLWLHWRQQVNVLKGRRRGTSVRVGAWLHLAVRALLVLMLAGIAVALSAALAVVGVTLARAGTGDAGGPLLALRIVTGLIALLAPLLAALRAGLGGVEGIDRLLLLPVSGRALHGLASAPFLADPFLLGVFPGLLMLAAAQLLRGPAAGAVALAAGLLFVLAVGAVTSATAHGIRLLLRDRRRAEAVIAIVVVAWLLVSVGPGLWTASRQRRQEPAAGPAQTERAVDGQGSAEASAEAPPPRRVGERFPWFLQAIPSEAYARSVARASAGAPLEALPSLGVLALVFGVGWEASRRLWRRLIASPAGGGRRGSASLPVWRPGGRTGGSLGAVASTVVRISYRTVQGKLALIMPVLATLAMAVMGKTEGTPFWRSIQGPALLVVAVFLGLTVNQNVLFNQFGIDRSGLSLELLLPVTARQLVAGRALGGGVLSAMSFLLGLAAAVVAGGIRSPLSIAATLLGFAGAYALLFPASALLSLLFPKPADLGKLSQAGKPTPAAALLGLAVLVMVLALAAGAGFAGFAAAGVPGALAAEALFAAVALLLLRPLLALIAAALERRREAIYLAVREG